LTRLQYYAADAVFAAALDRFPNSILMWQARGDLFTRWEKVEGARAFFLRALELESSAAGPLIGLALLYEKIESYAEAV
jgi:predicted RNA polymerase sigma factor